MFFIYHLTCGLNETIELLPTYTEQKTNSGKFIDLLKVTWKVVEFFKDYWKPRFNPWVGKIPWRRKWQPTPVFLPGESHGQRSLVGFSPRGHKESDTTE